MVSQLEEQLALHIRALRLPEPEREYQFAPPRRWRFDFAWPSLKLAIEVEGGVFVSGRHSRGVGFERDAEKYNAAVERGWQVLRYTSRMIRDGGAISQIERVIRSNEPCHYCDVVGHHSEDCPVLLDEVAKA